MVTSKTNEQAFEALIEKALVGSTVEERKASGQTNPDAQIEASKAEQMALQNAQRQAALTSILLGRSK